MEVGGRGGEGQNRGKRLIKSFKVDLEPPCAETRPSPLGARERNSLERQISQTKVKLARPRQMNGEMKFQSLFQTRLSLEREEREEDEAASLALVEAAQVANCRAGKAEDEARKRREEVSEWES